MIDILFSEGYFILGDSTYAIESFLIPPYDLIDTRTSEDDLNLIIQVKGLLWSVKLEKLICDGVFLEYSNM